MDYLKVYNELVEKRRTFPLKKTGDGMVETHHIIPKSYGGKNNKSNLINLTLREHFVAHLLLYHHAHREKDYVNAGKMVCSLYRMMSSRQCAFNSHVYEMLKTRKEMGVFWKNKKHKPSSRQKTREKMTPKDSQNPRVWVCKDGNVKYILKTKLQEFLNMGFELGRQGYKPRRNGQGKSLLISEEVIKEISQIKDLLEKGCSIDDICSTINKEREAVISVIKKHLRKYIKKLRLK